MKYKAGDTVRVLKSLENAKQLEHCIGSVGKITHIQDRQYPYKIEGVDDYWCDDELELVREFDTIETDSRLETSAANLLGDGEHDTEYLMKHWYYLRNSLTPTIMGLDTCCDEPCRNGGIKAFAKNLLLSKKEKLLRKHGLKDECGDFTRSAEAIVIAKLCADNEDYLVDIATKKDEESKK